MQAGQLVHGSGTAALWCAAESVLDWARASLRVARGRQLQQPLPMHAQHGHPAAHLLEATVRLEPAQELAGKRESWARERVGSSPISSHSRRISGR